MDSEEENISFSKEMRKATRDIHRISDLLVNAKLSFALSDNAVWAEGLLIFYEIFKYIEDNAPVELLPREYHRKAAFEADLNYYLGADWQRDYKPREAVQKYIDHLESVYAEDPILLMAFVYHLYMGLLSGGQILQKKRALAKRLNPLHEDDSATGHPGAELTHFEGYTIAELKQRMRELVDEKAKYFDDQLKQRLIEESRKVFELNNEIVKTVRGVNRVNLRKFGLFFIVLIVAYILKKFLFT